ncbi:hypothetical protein ACWDOP_23435 [Nocardia sp. NPDC003693]
MLGSVHESTPADEGDIDPRALGTVALASGLMVLAIGAGVLLTRSGDTGAAESTPTVAPPRNTAPALVIRVPQAPVAGVPTVVGVPPVAGIPPVAGVPPVDGVPPVLAPPPLDGVPLPPMGEAAEAGVLPPLDEPTPVEPATPHPVDPPILLPLP